MNYKLRIKYDNSIIIIIIIIIIWQVLFYLKFFTGQVGRGKGRRAELIKGELFAWAGCVGLSALVRLAVRMVAVMNGMVGVANSLFACRISSFSSNFF